MSRLVFLSLIIAGAFLGTVVPFYLAPYGFYNNFPVLTELYGLWFLLSVILIVTGIFYYTSARKAAMRKQM